MHPASPSRRGLVALAVGALVLASGGSACPLLDPGQGSGSAQVEGAPYGVGFEGASAGHKFETSGASPFIVVRIAPRPDVCEAVMDPVDTVDPSLVLTLSGAQAQSYQVVGLDYAGPPGGGAPPPTATVVLQTREHCEVPSVLDAGVEDAGPQCAVNRAAHSGQVVLESVAEGGRATGTFAVEFPEGGGSVSGFFDAPTCLQIR
jgi:hypothetical protein